MKKNQAHFTFIDLFSGIGGFRLALNNLGGQCLNFSEINKDAIHTYAVNFDEDITQNLGDITKIESLPKHDLLTGGVPCQSWSIAGRNLGFDDDRGQLWNDTIYLLNQSRPKAFIFENVKGLVDPRNKEALSYILKRIKEAGYYANYYVLNSFDYGVPQNRIRIYIIGFLETQYQKAFQLPKPIKVKIRFSDILFDTKTSEITSQIDSHKTLPSDVKLGRNMSLSNSKGFNDYFLFNDLRNGHSTIHSWDIIETTEHQKHICYLLLKNRRKSAYGNLDGNPLSLNHFRNLDKSITLLDLTNLVTLNILKEEEYTYSVLKNIKNTTLEERTVLDCAVDNVLNVDTLKNNRNLKLNKLPISKTLEILKQKGAIICSEIRYDFKNTKISTGLNGVSRIFLPSSDIFPTLVASDTNDFIALKDVNGLNADEYKRNFLENIYNKGLYRKITKEEACLIQGFPKDFLLPSSRARWMKLIGNSVSMPVIQILGQAIIDTGVFDCNSDTQEYELDKSYEPMAFS